MGIVIMIILGVVAVFLYFESSQNTEKVTIQIPVSEISEIIKEPLKLDAKTEPIHELPVLDCSGVARCLKGKVTKIIDGDTIKVDGQSVRFALVSAPEIGNLDGIKAKEYIEKICSVGSDAIIDEDDLQTQGSYGRILAEIHCNGFSLNEEILKAKLGKISVVFCSKSEFSSEPWAKKFGC